jgi:hypothetical protein
MLFYRRTIHITFVSWNTWGGIWDFRFSRRRVWRWQPSEIQRRVDLLKRCLLPLYPDKHQIKLYRLLTALWDTCPSWDSVDTWDAPQRWRNSAIAADIFEKILLGKWMICHNRSSSDKTDEIVAVTISSNAPATSGAAVRIKCCH